MKQEMIDGFDRKIEMETDTSELDLRSQNRNDMKEEEIEYSQEYEDYFDSKLEPVLREIWDDEGLVIGAFVHLKGEVRNIDRLLKFIKDNPGIDSDEVITEELCIEDGKDIRNYDHPKYKGQTPRKY